ncbi:MAG TPA: hypothetical protein PLG15_00390 [Candidatus Gastranaerophilaceae bacterium]|nr:hypothetical protein [Candidatus Gastranaerophilaceae bacterium]HPT40825.1 hypothetical protein [Candidatus Gastranaerophilaceae bacterium]
MKKVKIYTWADKTPEFIYRQLETINKFVKDEDFEFIVFNNTPITAYDRRYRIKFICQKLGIKCLDVRFRSFISGSAQICGWGIHWAFHRFFRWEKDTIHVVLDSDMFFIKDFCFNEYLGDNDICAIHQRRENIEYPWNGIMIFGGNLPDKTSLDFRLGTINGIRTDVGGKIYYWLKKNPDLKIKWMGHTGHLDISKSIILPESLRHEYKPEYCFQIIENSILHYRAGSNWDKCHFSFVDEKRAYFDKLLNALVYNGEKIEVSSEFNIYMQ